MDQEIQFSDIKLDYLSIAETRQRSGLRIVLGAYPVPGPWREACKGLFHVKGTPYFPVATANEGHSDLEFGANDADSELLAWTGQSSAPVAIWNDERPCASWVDQLYLAERLQPAPPLIPDDVEDRALMFGLCHELAGEKGFAWTKRLAIIHCALQTLPAQEPRRRLWEYMATKYRYAETEGAAGAPNRGAISSRTDFFRRRTPFGPRHLLGHFFPHACSVTT